MRPFPGSPIVSAASLISLILMAVFSATAQAEGWTGYVTTKSPAQLVPFNTADYSIGAPITLSAEPKGLAIAPDGRTAYVTAHSPSRVIAVDLNAGVESGEVLLPDPVNPIAITPDGTMAYVAAINTGIVYPIDLRRMEADTGISIGHQAWRLAVHPDGRSLYVSTGSDGGVSRMDLITGTVSRVGDTDAAMLGIAFKPDGLTGYAISSGLNQVYAINIPSGAPNIGAGFGAGTQPQEIAISPDGSTALATNFSYDKVTLLDLDSGSTGAAVDVGDYPSDVAVTPDGATAFVANMDSSDISPIDLASATADTAFSVGADSAPRWIAITPNQPPTARLTATDTYDDRPVRLDASASTDDAGEIASYEWDFGDGETAVTSSPVVEHRYPKGSYEVSVTLTDSHGCSLETVFTGQTASCNGSADIATAVLPITVTEPPPPPDEGDNGGGDRGAGGSDGRSDPGSGDRTPVRRPGRLVVELAPRHLSSKAGAKVRATLRIRNRGSRLSSRLRLCIRAPRRLVIPTKCRAVRRIRAGQVIRQRISFRVRRHARPGRRVPVRIKLTGRGHKAATARAVIRIR